MIATKSVDYGFRQIEKNIDIKPERIMEIANAATVEEAIANTNGKLSFYKLQYKLEQEGRITKRKTEPYETELITILDKCLEQKAINIALSCLRNVSDSFSRYDEYMELIRASTSCDHVGDQIPFACYRICKKCGELYNTK